MSVSSVVLDLPFAWLSRGNTDANVKFTTLDCRIIIFRKGGRIFGNDAAKGCNAPSDNSCRMLNNT